MLAAIVLVIALVSSSCGDATDVAASRGEDPAEPVLTDGHISATGFWERVAALPFNEMAFTLTPPSDVGTLVAGSSIVVDGTVKGLEIVRTTWKPDPSLMKSAGRLVVRITVGVEEVLHGVGVKTGADIAWDINAWMGDPTQIEQVAAEVSATMGNGPIGARVVLFLTPVPEKVDAEGTWFALTGVMDDGTTVARLDPGRVAESRAEFASADELSAAISRF
jgi:hypothetical protein